MASPFVRDLFTAQIRIEIRDLKQAVSDIKNGIGPPIEDVGRKLRSVIKEISLLKPPPGFELSLIHI